MKPETGNRSTRVLFLALLAASGLAACRNDAVPGSSVQVSAVPSPAPAPAPAAARRPVMLRFSTDSPVIGSQVGKRELGAGMSTTGKAGWLVFGPYIRMEAGTYQANVVGFAQPDHSGLVRVDIASERGKRIIAALELDAAALLAGQSPDALVIIPFTLDSAVDDLEVRVRVDENSRLAVSEFQIRSTP